MPRNRSGDARNRETLMRAIREIQGEKAKAEIDTSAAKGLARATVSVRSERRGRGGGQGAAALHMERSPEPTGD